MSSKIKTTQSVLFGISAVILILGSISACTTTPTPTVTPIISSDKAIEIAIGGCKIPHLVLVGEPQNIRTELSTLEEADKLTMGEGEYTSFTMSMDTKVWLVKLDGQLQLVGGPIAIITEDSQVITPTPPQPFWGTCSVILDATSGAIILIRG